jgi:hypothetical protein
MFDIASIDRVGRADALVKAVLPFLCTTLAPATERAESGSVTIRER